MIQNLITDSKSTGAIDRKINRVTENFRSTFRRL